MECEICGKEAGRGRQIMLDGSRLLACDECAAFGTEIAQKPAESRNPSLDSAKRLGFSRKEENFDLGLEIEQDFGARIRNAREAKGMTVKELAMKIFERESVLHRMENQGIKPSDALIAKLQKALGIRLKSKEQ